MNRPRSALIALSAVPILSACIPANPVETSEPALAATPDACDAEAGAAYIGREVTDALGPQLLAATGAETLRIAHRNGPLTMDYRPERLTVLHDDDRLIVSLRCG